MYHRSHCDARCIHIIFLLFVDRNLSNIVGPKLLLLHSKLLKCSSMRCLVFSSQVERTIRLNPQQAYQNKSVEMMRGSASKQNSPNFPFFKQIYEYNAVNFIIHHRYFSWQLWAIERWSTELSKSDVQHVQLIQILYYGELVGGIKRSIQKRRESMMGTHDQLSKTKGMLILSLVVVLVEQWVDSQKRRQSIISLLAFFLIQMLQCRYGAKHRRDEVVITEENRSTLALVYVAVIIVRRCADWSILMNNQAASYQFLEHGNIVHQTRGFFVFS